MRKFWKKQIEDLGGDPSVLIQSRTQLAREMFISLVAVHGGTITIRNAGYVIGRAACIFNNPAWGSGRASKTALISKRR